MSSFVLPPRQIFSERGERRDAISSIVASAQRASTLKVLTGEKKKKKKKKERKKERNKRE